MRKFVLRSLLVAALAIGASGIGQANAAPRAASTPPPTQSQGSTFVPVNPTRVLDTRNRTGFCGTLGDGPNNGCYLALGSIVPATATAVVLNVTGTNPSTGTYVTVTPQPGNGLSLSNLNLGPGETRANQVTVALSPYRSVSFTNFVGTVDLIADLDGYYVSDSSGAGFTSLSPTRVLDTRNGSGPVTAGSTVTVDLSGQVPAGATAVTVNLAATDVTKGTYVTAYPAGAGGPPLASSINLVPGDTRANLVTVALSADRKVTFYNFTGSVDLVVDLAGYYQSGTGTSFYSYTPTRVLDTRDNNGNPTSNTLGPDTRMAMDTSRWLPPSAQAVVFNFTGTNTTAGTYLTAYPDGTSRPVASNVNLAPGQTVPNLTVVAIGSDHKIDLYNFAGNTDVLADVAGYFAPPPTLCTSQCLYAWGRNSSHGSLAQGTTGGSADTIQQVPVLSGVTAVSSGGDGGLALRSDGTVWAWGQNLTKYGPVPNGFNSGFDALPRQITGLPASKAVAGSSVNGAALATDGTVWVWGQYYGSAAQAAPIQAPGLTNIVAVAADGISILALRNDGTVWVWGANDYDVYNNGSGYLSPTPVQVPGLSGITSIALSNSWGMAVDNNGAVWEWGDVTAVGFPGQGLSQVPGLTGMSLAAPNFQTGYAVRKSDGTVWAWGNGTWGQLGNGTTSNSATPVEVSGLSGVTSIAAGFDYSAVALKSDGTLWNWGTGLYGPPSNPGGSSSSSTVPVQIPDVSGATAIATTPLGTNYAVLPS
ncbi:MAG TPA: hypothetical protein VGM75_34675 [Pseudonocardiaceae bacterium]